jgi:CHASE2 domain-containing sensor protein
MLRGPQPIESDIVLVYLSREDAIRFSDLDPSRNMLWSLKEIVETSDSFFWHPDFWDKALAKVMNAGAKASVITLFFSDDTIKQSATNSRYPNLRRAGVFWSAKSDIMGSSELPGLAYSDTRNTGTLDIRPDTDGKIRHFSPMSVIIPHISIRAAQYINKSSTSAHYGREHVNSYINYHGPSSIFKSISFSELVSSSFKTEQLRNKTVIFGLRDNSGHTYQTPMGSMSDSALTATLIYNLLHSRWITSLPTWLNMLLMLLLLIFCMRIIFYYPPTVALVFLSFISLGIVGLSAALFDIYAIW